MASANPPMPATAWSWQVRLLHWLTVILVLPQTVIALLFIGSGMGSLAWLSVHVSLGVVLFAVIVSRIVLRVTIRAVPRSGILAATLQILLYITLLAVALTGWLSYRPAAFSPRNVLFGLAPLPRLRWQSDLPWLATHRVLVWLFVVLLALHIGAVVFHSFVKKDGTLTAMLRGRSRT